MTPGCHCRHPKPKPHPSGTPVCGTCGNWIFHEELTEINGLDLFHEGAGSATPSKRGRRMAKGKRPHR